MYRCRLTSIGIPMLKIRRSGDRLIFNMGIPIPGKDSLYIETGPWSSSKVVGLRLADLWEFPILVVTVIALPTEVEGYCHGQHYPSVCLSVQLPGHPPALQAIIIHESQSYLLHSSCVPSWTSLFVNMGSLRQFWQFLWNFECHAIFWCGPFKSSVTISGTVYFFYASWLLVNVMCWIAWVHLLNELLKLMEAQGWLQHVISHQTHLKEARYKTNSHTV